MKEECITWAIYKNPLDYPDTSYVGRFIVRSRVYVRHDAYSSIYYEKEIIPFVVRT